MVSSAYKEREKPGVEKEKCTGKSFWGKAVLTASALGLATLLEGCGPCSGWRLQRLGHRELLENAYPRRGWDRFIDEHLRLTPADFNNELYWRFRLKRYQAGLRACKEKVRCTREEFLRRGKAFVPALTKELMDNRCYWVYPGFHAFEDMDKRHNLLSMGRTGLHAKMAYMLKSSERYCHHEVLDYFASLSDKTRTIKKELESGLAKVHGEDPLRKDGRVRSEMIGALGEMLDAYSEILAPAAMLAVQIGDIRILPKIVKAWKKHKTYRDPDFEDKDIAAWSIVTLVQLNADMFMAQGKDAPGVQQALTALVDVLREGQGYNSMRKDLLFAKGWAARTIADIVKKDPGRMDPLSAIKEISDAEIRSKDKAEALIGMGAPAIPALIKLAHAKAVLTHTRDNPGDHAFQASVPGYLDRYIRIMSQENDNCWGHFDEKTIIEAFVKMGEPAVSYLQKARSSVVGFERDLAASALKMISASKP
ncbi:MAG: hypothetical protein V1827_01660 [Candidatus Micrarchaeota archaeon]